MELKTGIIELDNIRGGFKPSEMVVLGARPSVGKTALAGSLALKMAKDGEACRYNKFRNVKCTTCNSYNFHSFRY